MSEKFEFYDPSGLTNTKKEAEGAEYPHADIKKMYSPYELEELIKASEGERQRAAVARLKEVLKEAILGFERGIATPYTDETWVAGLKEQKAHAEERLKALANED